MSICDNNPTSTSGRGEKNIRQDHSDVETTSDESGPDESEFGASWPRKRSDALKFAFVPEQEGLDRMILETFVKRRLGATCQFGEYKGRRGFLVKSKHALTADHVNAIKDLTNDRSARANLDEDRTKISDLPERRRIQNQDSLSIQPLGSTDDGQDSLSQYPNTETIRDYYSGFDFEGFPDSEAERIYSIQDKRIPQSNEEQKNSKSEYTDPNVRTSPFFRPGKLFDLPLILEGSPIKTFPDSGSEINAISLNMLRALKLKTQANCGSADNEVEMADKSSIKALCQVQLYVEFPASVSVPQDGTNWTFHVLYKLTPEVQVIIGQKFLKTYQIFTKLSHSLQERLPSSVEIPRCMSVGVSGRTAQCMRAYLDQRLVLVLADSGSEVDLMSREYAQKQGFNILPLQPGQNSSVQFADSSIGEITGQVVVRFTAFEDVSGSRAIMPKREPKKGCTHPGMIEAIRDEPMVKPMEEDANTLDNRVTFYILNELAHDVILSQQRLHSMDAYNRYSSAFVNVEQERKKKACCTIFWYKGRRFETNLNESQIKQREVAREKEFENKKKLLEQKIAESCSDPGKQTALEFELAEIGMQDQEDRIKYEKELEAVMNDMKQQQQKEEDTNPAQLSSPKQIGKIFGFLGQRPG